MRFFALSLILATAALGCGATSSGDTSASGGAGGTGGASGMGVSDGGGVGNTDSVGIGPGPGAGSGTPGGDPANNCSDAAQLIYVLSDDNDLYSFAPDQKKFTKIGPLGCKTTLSPNSMAVDRDANAYVNYVSGNDSQGVIFKVSTKDASCNATPVVGKLPKGFTRLGMGYSTDMVGGTVETLYVAGTSNSDTGAKSPGLAKIDLATGSLVPLGSFTGSLKGQSGELTGTGDARLFGFFTTDPVRLAEIDKTTGATKTPVDFDNIQTPNAWAFSFWGGDFYFYTATSGNTNVSRYRPSDKSVDTKYMTNIGFRIVGAGVSTCAPLVPPVPK